jgi:hypothetical protein
MIKARNISAFMRQIHTDPKLKDKNLSLWEHVMATAGILLFLGFFYNSHVVPFSEEWAPGRRDWIYFWPFFPLFSGFFGFFFFFFIYITIIYVGWSVNAAARSAVSILRRTDRGG